MSPALGSHSLSRPFSTSPGATPGRCPPGPASHHCARWAGCPPAAEQAGLGEGVTSRAPPRAGVGSSSGKGQSTGKTLGKGAETPCPGLGVPPHPPPLCATGYVWKAAAFAANPRSLPASPRHGGRCGHCHGSHPHPTTPGPRLDLLHHPPPHTHSPPPRQCNPSPDPSPGPGGPPAASSSELY